MNFDLLLWQVPALGLTAQAFLLGVGLSATSSPWSRVLTGALGILTTAVGVQLMAKQRHFEVWDSNWLEEYEEQHNLPRVHAQRPAERGLAKHGSYEAWVVALLAFGAVALASMASGILQIVTDEQYGGWFSA